jgi:glycosyltransferase involved in cell wall biosynthesis
MPDLEVIVVDDGSTDSSLMILADIHDPRLTIVHQANRGLAGARNTGILLARAPLIGLLDSDDIWYPQKAEAQMKLMQDQSIGMTFSHSAYLDEAGTPTGQLLVTRCNEPTARDLANRNVIGNGSTPILRKECFDDGRIFCEELRSSEDTDLWIRIAGTTSWRIVLCPQVLTGYRVRHGSMTLDFATFLEQGKLVVQRMKSVIPDLSEKDRRRSYAGFIRIASRKALSDGQLQYSRKLLIAALREDPSLPLYDVRAFALILIHLVSAFLPTMSGPSAYGAVLRVTARIYKTLHPTHQIQKSQVNRG